MDDKEYGLVLRILELEIAYYESLKGGPGSGRRGNGGRKPKGKIIKQTKLAETAKEIEALQYAGASTFGSITKQFPELSDAIRSWSVTAYGPIRKIQQGKDMSNFSAGRQKELNDMAKEMQNNFDKLPQFSGPISRNINADIKNFKEGDTATMDAFSSFTAKAEYAGRYNIHLVVENNISGRAVWGLSASEEEMEVLVSKGTSYTVTRVEHDPENERHVVYLRENKKSKSAISLSEVLNSALDSQLKAWL